MNKKKAIEFFLYSFDITDAEQEFIDTLSLITTVVKKNRKEIIFLEGQTGTSFYFLISGSVKLLKTSDNGKEAVIHFAEPGEFFAEVALFMHNIYPVTAIAIKNSELLCIDSKKMLSIIQNKPSFSLKFIGMLAKRLSYLTNIIQNLSTMDAEEKFLNYLNMIKKDDNVATLNIPKGEIALLLGISPETFSRVLKKLLTEHKIEIDNKRIKINV